MMWELELYLNQKKELLETSLLLLEGLIFRPHFPRSFQMLLVLLMPVLKPMISLHQLSVFLSFVDDCGVVLFCCLLFSRHSRCFQLWCSDPQSCLLRFC